MEGNGPNRSQKGPRFVLFLLDTKEERIPFSYSQLKIGYSRLAESTSLITSRCGIG